MSLSSLQLEAFLAVARRKHFSKAAMDIGLTQSALSQRVKQLEEFLETSLFIRSPGSIFLTPTGERLLRYCHIKEGLEEEFLQELQSNDKKSYSGNLRIATYSSVLRSVILPSLAAFLRKNPKVNIQFLIREMGELPQLLQSSEADFIILDYPLALPHIVEDVLGEETYVMIESSKYNSRQDVYLDHDPQDTATLNFFRHQKRKVSAFKRAFMGEVYSIIDAVAQGLGRAVISQHLLQPKMPVRIDTSFKTYKRQVVLHYPEQAFYPRLHLAVIQELIRQSHSILNSPQKRTKHETSRSTHTLQ